MTDSHSFLVIRWWYAVMLVAKVLTVVSFAAVLCQFYTEARLRDKVIQIGTTLGPDFHRPEGKSKNNSKICGIFVLKLIWKLLIPHFPGSVPCPESHSYGFNNGHDCCRTYDKVNDTKIHEDCDGGKMTAGTNFLCCQNQDSVSCPWGQICSDRRRGKLIWFQSRWCISWSLQTQSNSHFFFNFPWKSIVLVKLDAMGMQPHCQHPPPGKVLHQSSCSTRGMPTGNEGCRRATLWGSMGILEWAVWLQQHLLRLRPPDKEPNLQQPHPDGTKWGMPND